MPLFHTTKQYSHGNNEGRVQGSSRKRHALIRDNPPQSRNNQEETAPRPVMPPLRNALPPLDHRLSFFTWEMIHPRPYLNYSPLNRSPAIMDARPSVDLLFNVETVSLHELRSAKLRSQKFLIKQMGSEEFLLSRDDSWMEGLIGLNAGRKVADGCAKEGDFFSAHVNCIIYSVID